LPCETKRKQKTRTPGRQKQKSKQRSSWGTQTIGKNPRGSGHKGKSVRGEESKGGSVNILENERVQRNTNGRGDYRVLHGLHTGTSAIVETRFIGVGLELGGDYEFKEDAQRGPRSVGKASVKFSKIVPRRPPRPQVHSEASQGEATGAASKFPWPKQKNRRPICPVISHREGGYRLKHRLCSVGGNLRYVDRSHRVRKKHVEKKCTQGPNRRFKKKKPKKGIVL